MHTTALCSPSRSCIVTGRNHHSNGMAAHHRAGDRLSRLQRHHPVRERLPLGDAARARLQHLHGRQVAPDAEQPGDRRRAVRPLAAGARLRALLRLPRRRHQPVVSRPGLRQPPGRAAGDARGGLPPHRGPGRQVDRSSSPTPSRSTPDKPFYLHLCFGADARAAPRAEGVGRPVRRAVRRRLGRLPREGLRPAEGAGHRPRRRRAVAARPRRPRLGLAARAGAPAVQPDDGGVRRLPQPHRPPPRPAARLPARAGRARQHARHGDLRQRRQRRGRARPAPPTRRSSSTTPRSRSRTAWRAIDEIGGPTHFNHYPWGWTWAGNTPFRRWKRETYRGGVVRPVHRPLAAGHQGAGARSARSTRTSSTWCRPCSTCSGIEPPATHPGRHPVTAARRQLRAHLRRRRRPRRDHHTQYFEMFGHRAIYHDGWRAVCPWPGPSFAEAGVGFGQPDLRPRRSPSSTPTGWELYHVGRGLRREPQRRRGAPRQAHRADRHRGTSRPASTACCPIDGSGLARHDRREARRSPRPRTSYIYRPDTQSVPFFAGPRVLNRPHSITADVEIPDGGAEGVLLCQGTAAGGYSLLRQGRPAALRPQLRRPQPAPASSSPEPLSRPARTSSASSSSRPASRTSPTARARPGRLQLYVDGDLVAEAEAPVTTPFAFNPGALTCGANPGSPVTPDYPSPFRFTGTLHTRHRRRVRRAHHRQRERDAHGHGPAVGPRFYVSPAIRTEQAHHHRPSRGTEIRWSRRQQPVRRWRVNVAVAGDHLQGRLLRRQPLVHVHQPDAVEGR